jgi:hypothetical protein
MIAPPEIGPAVIEPPLMGPAVIEPPEIGEAGLRRPTAAMVPAPAHDADALTTSIPLAVMVPVALQEACPA